MMCIPTVMQRAFTTLNGLPNTEPTNPVAAEVINTWNSSGNDRSAGGADRPLSSRFAGWKSPSRGPFIAIRYPANPTTPRYHPRMPSVLPMVTIAWIDPRYRGRLAEFGAAGQAMSLQLRWSCNRVLATSNGLATMVAIPLAAAAQAASAPGFSNDTGIDTCSKVLNNARKRS